MNWLDIAILLVVGLSTLTSVTRGFVREAISLGSWLAAFIIARLFSPQLSVLLDELVPSSSMRMALSFFILFTGTLMIGAIVAKLLRQVLRFTGLSTLDRLLGMVFGFARGLLVVMVVVIGLRAFTPIEQQAFWQASELMPHVEMMERWTRQVAADILGDSWSETVLPAVPDPRDYLPST